MEWVRLILTWMDSLLGGKNIAELRDSTGVKVGISKVVQGVPDRVLTAVGTVESVAKVSKSNNEMTCQ